MKKKNVYVVIGLAICAMVGILATQAYWIRKAALDNQQRFNRQVQHALRETNEQLEKREAFRFLSSDLDIVKQESEERIKFKNLFRSVLTADSAQLDSLNKILLAEVAGKELVDSNQLRSIRRRLREDGNYPNESIVDLMEGLDLKVRDSLKKMITGDIDRLFDEMNVFSRLLVEMSSSHKPVHHRIDFDELGTIIEENLRSTGIETSFTYAISEPFSKRFIYTSSVHDTASLKESKYNIKLFRNYINVNSPPYSLVLSFPRQSFYVLGSIKFVFASSLLFVLILAFSFWYMIHNFMKQRKLSRMKTDFINNMTHELKTPLSTISLAAEALNDTGISLSKERIQKYTRLISNENKRLEGQVERVLQIAKMERNTIELQKEPVELNEVVRTVIDNFSLRINEQGGDIHFNCRLAKAWINGDKVHLTNILYNLIDNAIKYTEHAPVIQISSSRHLKNKVRIEVKDNGIGIDKDQQKKIFDQFYRVSTGNVHDVKGFGLGLHYVQRMVEEHDADIEVNSIPGKGSTFSLIFPLLKEDL